MPIHDVGYRPWEGKRTSQLSRWSIISLTGIQLAGKSRWVKRIMFVAWLPVMYWGVGFFFIEKAIDSGVDEAIQANAAMDDQAELPVLVIAETAEGVAAIEEEPDSEPDQDLSDDNQIPIELDPGADIEALQLQRLIDQQKLKAEIAQAEGVIVEIAQAMAEKIQNAHESGLPIADGQLASDLKSLENDLNREKEELMLLLAQVVEETKDQQTRNAIGRSLRNRFAAFPHAAELAESLESGDTARIRNDVWRWLLMVFFRYPQSFLILFLIGTIAPSLISRDLRSRAFLLYFSRPIGKIEYIFGKLCIPAAFIIAITTLPALALYCFAVLMSPSIFVIFNTWDIPLRIIAASFALVIPTASIALMLSSLTHESRYASFSWFALWVLGEGAYLAILIATGTRMASQSNGDFQVSDAIDNEVVRNWSSVSLYNCLGDTQELIFGFGSFEHAWRGILTLVVVTLFSLIILYRRVSAPIRV